MAKSPKKRDGTKSGIMPRPILEPEARREPLLSPALPENKDEHLGTTTTLLPVNNEGADRTATRDDDPATTG